MGKTMLNEIEEALRKKIGSHLCQTGLHDMKRNGICRRCRRRVGPDLAKLDKLFKSVAEEFISRLREQTMPPGARTQYGPRPGQQRPLKPPKPTVDWRKVLGFGKYDVVNLVTLKERYRVLAWRAHPDHGGRQADFVKITAARDAALKELKRG